MLTFCSLLGLDKIYKVCNFMLFLFETLSSKIVILKEDRSTMEKLVKNYLADFWYSAEICWILCSFLTLY